MIKFSAEDLKRILAVSDGSEPEPVDVPLTTPNGAAEAEKVQDEFVFLPALEGDQPDPTWPLWQVVLDSAIQAAQPAPAMTHVELVLPPITSDEPYVHFATYLGMKAGWANRFRDTSHFYLKNLSSWRAVPIMANGASQRCRNECSLHNRTPYAPFRYVWKYPFSVPPFRALASLLSDAPQTSAHCATISTRIVRRALPEAVTFSQPSAWYGPSTLYIDLSRKSRMKKYQNELQERDTVLSNVEAEEEEHAIRTLVFEPQDDNVRNMTTAQCRMAIQKLARRAIDASVAGDPTMERLTQNQLAKALIRWSFIQHVKHARYVPPDETLR